MRVQRISLVCKYIGSAVNTGKTNYIEVGCHHGMMANEHILVGSNLYEKVKTLKCFGFLLTNQNSIQEEIKCKLGRFSSYADTC